jgi:hypothetical protein
LTIVPLVGLGKGVESMQRRMRWWGEGLAIVLVLTAAVLALGSSRALGHEGEDEEEGRDDCRPACNEVRGVCKDASRNGYLACKRDCRASLMPDGCYAECRAKYAGMRGECKDGCKDCKSDCPPDGVPPSECEQACMVELRECAAGLRDAGKVCAEGCTAVAREAIGGCFEAEEVIPCLLQATRELGECLGGCAHDMRDGAEGCSDVAKLCRERCEGGSASRAFLDPSPSLLD